MGKSGGSGETIVRYAPYLEENHQALITQSQGYVDSLIGSSPFANMAFLDPDDGFLGDGYSIDDYPSLFDMFGKFMAGLDVEVLHEQIMMDSIYDIALNEAVAAESSYLTDQLTADAYIRLDAGARDINACMTTGYIAGKSQLEDSKIKALAKFKADLKIQFTNLGHQRWVKHLEWNDQVVKTYSPMIQAYYTVKSGYTNDAAKLAEQDAVWPFNVLNYHRAIVGALNGAQGASQKTDSTLNQVLGTVSTVIGIAGMLSSRRFKENIKTLGYLGKVRVVSFVYKWNKAVEYIGVIAEEVVEIFPEVVFLDRTGRPVAVNYGLLNKLIGGR